MLPAVLWARRFIVWVLVIALPVYGSAGVLLHLLGAPHRHQAVENTAQAQPWNIDCLLTLVVGERAMSVVLQHRAKAVVTQAAHRHDPHGPVHQHGLFERHHHDADDPSVVALGGLRATSDLADEATSSAAVGSAMLVFALGAELTLPPPSPREFRWPPAALVAWNSLNRPPLERPPRLSGSSVIDGRATASS
jgi:hypothetical protein